MIDCNVEMSAGELVLDIFLCAASKGVRKPLFTGVLIVLLTLSRGEPPLMEKSTITLGCSQLIFSRIFANF